MNGLTLARDLLQAADPVALAESVGMKAQPWQVEALRSRAKRLLLNCSRQAGKTTVAGVLATHTALYQPGALVIALAAAERQASELVRVARSVYSTVGRAVDSSAESRLAIELENGSRIIALPASASTIRGYSGVSLLIVDEAAQVPDEVYMTMRATLAVSGGRLILMSTPYGRRGFFYEAWRDRRRGEWEAYRVTADQCPHIDPAFIAEERRQNPHWWVQQEYFGEFHDAQTQAFRGADIEASAEKGGEEWPFGSAWT